MSGKGVWFKQRPNKKRKYNDFQDSQSQTRHPINPLVGRPPQGPRGKYYHSALKQSTPQGPRNKYYNSAPKHQSPQQVEYHDGKERSTSRDQLRSPWRTSSEGTPSSNLPTQSEYFQSQVAPGNRGYYPQYCTSNLETQSHYLSIEPEIDQSTQGRTNNCDARDDVIDFDSYDIAPLETPLPMADPTFSNLRIEQDDDEPYSNDSVMDTDDALHEAEMPVDNFPVPTVGDQENDQNWEDSYEVEDRATEVLSAPQSAPQLAPVNTATLDSIFNVADDSMADVTDNPWTSP